VFGCFPEDGVQRTMVVLQMKQAADAAVFDNQARGNDYLTARR
jgi:hypothetical protein